MGIESYRAQARRDPFGLPEVLDELEVDDADHELDQGKNLELHRDLMQWYAGERTKQAINRYQMAIDEDFYDGLQWHPDDVATLLERGQAALVFNLVKPTVDWLIGTQKRTQMDWRVLPRRNDPQAGESAQAKTAWMKYLDDINHGQHTISRAFKESVIAGLGWIEAGVRGDLADEIIYENFESWRNVLHDSSSKAIDYNTDGRYLFRWKWIDLDIAEAMFPDRIDILKQAVTRQTNLMTGSIDEEGEEFWYLGQVVASNSDYQAIAYDRRAFVSDTNYINYRRKRVRLIEGWYTKPVNVKVMRGDHPLNGTEFDDSDPEHVTALMREHVGLYDTLAMKMNCAIFNEQALLWKGGTIYKHNRFPFTPIWCYRRGRDLAPYGVVRQIRDAQEDYNKRASKALWILSTNRVIMDKGAVDDIDETRNEVARPDSFIQKNKGFEFEIKNDAALAAEQIQLMERDHGHIQAVSGVTDENMGRQTNATSGLAIQARQLQGSVVTAEPFDNLRFARQIHGQNMLSVSEQFVTEPRVIRMTGAKNAIEWIHLNQPQQGDDGSIRFLNDITAEQADFIVADEDYHTTLRQSMFEELMGFLGKIPDPNLALKLLPHVMDMSDLPDKDAFIAEIRQELGLPTPQQQSPEQQQQAVQQEQAQQAQQQQQQQLQAQAAQLQLAESQARLGLTQAQTQKTLADAEKSAAEAEAKRNGENLQLLIEQVAHLRQMIQHLAHPINQSPPEAPQ